MATKLFITATNTNIGKTYTACAILELLGSKGVKIGAFKAVETGVTNIPQDASKMLEICKKYNKNFKNFTPSDICGFTFELPAAPYVADKEGIFSIKIIKDKIEKLDKLCDFLLIEGAGGLYVPLKKSYFVIDLIKELKFKTLLVTPSYLGCINESLLSINALEQAGVDYSWCVNLHKDKESFEKITKPFYDSYFDNWQTLDEFLNRL